MVPRSHRMKRVGIAPLESAYSFGVQVIEKAFVSGEAQELRFGSPSWRALRLYPRNPFSTFVTLQSALRNCCIGHFHEFTELCANGSGSSVFNGTVGRRPLMIVFAQSRGIARRQL